MSPKSINVTHVHTAVFCSEKLLFLAVSARVWQIEEEYRLIPHGLGISLVFSPTRLHPSYNYTSSLAGHFTYVVASL